MAKRTEEEATMNSCPICDGGNILTIERRDAVPIAQNLVFPCRHEAIQCPAGPLEILRCASCGFVWNAAFDSALLVYDNTYDNDQNFSPRFRDHTEEVAEVIAANAPCHESVRLIEVGCGQGAFLQVLARKFGDRLQSAQGFDPAWKGDSEALPLHCHVRAEYFNAVLVGLEDRPNLIVSRHVIEHVPDTNYFLRAIRASVRDGALLIIETPDVDWTLRNGVFFDFYYEHCSLFTPLSLSIALEAAGFAVDHIQSVFEEQYMLAVARAATLSVARQPAQELGDLGYCDKRDRYLTDLGLLIDCKRQLGLVALWGGASKGVTICLTLQNAGDRIDCVIDINERKQGCFLPTSGISIVGPADAWARGVRTAIVVNPAYLPEIRALCVSQGLDFNLVSIEEVKLG